jgi:hypothetical protein
MATPQTKTTRQKGTRARTSSRKSTGAASLDRLNASLEAAQKALTDLSGNLGRGGRDLLKDVQKMVRDARRDTLRLNKALVADLDQLQKTVTGRGGRGQPEEPDYAGDGDAQSRKRPHRLDALLEVDRVEGRGQEVAPPQYVGSKPAVGRDSTIVAGQLQAALGNQRSSVGLSGDVVELAVASGPRIREDLGRGRPQLRRVPHVGVPLDGRDQALRIAAEQRRKRGERAKELDLALNQNPATRSRPSDLAARFRPSRAKSANSAPAVTSATA